MTFTRITQTICWRFFCGNSCPVIRHSPEESSWHATSNNINYVVKTVVYNLVHDFGWFALHSIIYTIRFYLCLAVTHVMMSPETPTSTPMMPIITPTMRGAVQFAYSVSPVVVHMETTLGESRKNRLECAL